MITIEARAYVGESDLQAIVDLINACESVDKLEQGVTLDVLRMEFNDPWMDPFRNLRLWHTSEGGLIGMGQIITPDSQESIEGRLFVRVHPEHRDGDLDDVIISWAETRMREIGHERGIPARLRSSVRDDQTALRALLEQHGFVVTRYTWEMACSLVESLPEPHFPEGFTLRPIRGEQDAEPWIEMFNQTWIDHYGGNTWPVERYKNWLSDPDHRDDLSLVALAPDGTFAAFCWCRISPEENKRNGRNDGFIDLLGTRRGYRRIGLGRAMLLAGMERLRESGADTVKLGVDAASLTGANRLYESVGYHTEYTWIALTKHM